jgi:hypothetical protein
MMALSQNSDRLQNTLTRARLALALANTWLSHHGFAGLPLQITQPKP